MRYVSAISAAVVGLAALGAAPAALAHPSRCDGRVVFTRFDDSGIPNLFSTGSCGGRVVQITTAGGHQADLSSDERWLAYDSIPAGESTTDVYLARADGSGARDLTNTPGENDLQPDFSPDGRSLAYSVGTDGARDARIAVLDLRSGRSRVITPALPAQESFDPSWSPSGHRIVFDTLNHSGPGYLYVVRADGQRLHRITGDADDACQPDWGPNGLIAYAGGCDEEQSHLFLRDPRGRRVRRLTTDPGGSSAQLPAFSPDGRSLTFSRFDAAFDDADVWRLELDGGAETDLAPGPSFDSWSTGGPASR